MGAQAVIIVKHQKRRFPARAVIPMLGALVCDGGSLVRPAARARGRARRQGAGAVGGCGRDYPAPAKAAAGEEFAICAHIFLIEIYS